jgi:hypothetical protein
MSKFDPVLTVTIGTFAAAKLGAFMANTRIDRTT